MRPLHSIVCTFGPETEEPEVVDFEVDGIRAGNVTYGHRFLAPGRSRCAASTTMPPSSRRPRSSSTPTGARTSSSHGARDQALALGLELVEDEGLLEEVAGLVEWPVVLVGSFEEEFLEIPPEVIRATIRANQKCFVAAGAPRRLARRRASSWSPISRRPTAARRSPPATARHPGAALRCAVFLGDRPAPLPDLTDAMRAAAERLKLDLTKPLDQRMAKLAATNVIFHEKLGTQGERVERIARLARELAPLVGRRSRTRPSARRVLAKADLMTEMVGEFPELQGLMGRYYATAQGEDPSVAAAIEDHYKPVGPSDRVPTDPVAIAVALADKLDTLVGFWAIDEKPTGSKDPYALRRAALGVIRIVLGSNRGFA